MPADAAASPAASPAAYGRVARALHWLTAALILVMFALGLAASNWPQDSGAAFAVKAALFSAHKTLGLIVLGLAGVRILWAVAVPSPRPLAEHAPWVRWLAGTTHWALYVAICAVPLTGWLHHAASEGFAPIWWPFGQTLPLVPRDPEVSAAFGAMHRAAVVALAGLALVHAAGALKHHLRDRDATLLRMTRGVSDGAPTAPRPALAARALPALALWAAVLGLALALPREAPVAESAPGAGQGNWAVQEGTLAIAVRQMNDTIEGRFGTWTADIVFGEQPVEGRHGSLRVEIDVGSLRLGSVTSDALGPAFLDAGGHPKAVFEGDILAAPEGGYVAEGTLALRGAEVPVRMPFSLEIEGDTARAEGAVTLDRRDFGVGATFADEATVGYTVDVRTELTAIRRPEG
jgi:cytochrome b561/polyisoprenoid-binding protein YceI